MGKSCLLDFESHKTFFVIMNPILQFDMGCFVFFDVLIDGFFEILYYRLALGVRFEDKTEVPVVVDVDGFDFHFFCKLQCNIIFPIIGVDGRSRFTVGGLENSSFYPEYVAGSWE